MILFLGHGVTKEMKCYDQRIELYDIMPSMSEISDYKENQRNNLRDLRSMTESEVVEYVCSIGEKAFRGRQIFKWLGSGAESFDDMTNIPKDLRAKLKETSCVSNLKEKQKQISKDGTVKFLFELNDSKDGSIDNQSHDKSYDKEDEPSSELQDCKIAIHNNDKNNNNKNNDINNDINNNDKNNNNKNNDINNDINNNDKNNNDKNNNDINNNNKNNSIETVFMKYKYGNSICISSQAGCRMNCSFCASGKLGLVRNLTAGEMIDQIIKAEKITGEEINHVVVMGTGEPFDNYENLGKFIEIANSKEGLNIGKRNITVSTSGLIPQIEKFAKDYPQVNLAVSLHAPTDEIRSEMMPVNNKYPIAELMRACKKYTTATGRRITFEYAVVAGVNDRDEDIEKLKALLRGMLCHVNLIPLNEVLGDDGKPILKSGTRQRANEISDMLNAAGITATVRRSLGGDIDAACGQLRLK